MSGTSFTRPLRFVGALILLTFVTGLFSVAPAIDSPNYLLEARGNFDQSIFAALNQFVLALIYLAIALVLYPLLASFNKALTISFLSLRIVATTLMIMGTLQLLSILSLSQNIAQTNPMELETLSTLGSILKTNRDNLNHVFMVLVLATSNLLLYYLLYVSKCIPKWLSISGFLASVLSILASILLLFQVYDVISSAYLILNAPTALVELTLASGLLFAIFSKSVKAKG
tara:strand:+ start:607 stop:1293 length:687 start_codon:yes stop_codon:yes gene_type:complete